MSDNQNPSKLKSSEVSEDSEVTTVRLSKLQRLALQEISEATKATRNSLVSMAIDAFVDYAQRTGKLLVPNAKKKKTAKADTSHGA